MVRRPLHLAVAAAMLAAGCNSIFGIQEGTPRPICVDSPGEPLIDDMEDGTGSICALGGRRGGWFTVGDRTSANLTPAPSAEFKPTLIPGGRGTSRYAARFTGGGFTDWGALMGFGLNGNDQGLGTLPYDASGGIAGIKFWMKSTTPVSLNFPIPDTIAPKEGGQCADTATAANCNNHFHFDITAPSLDWVEYEVPFEALRQFSGGAATWNPRFLSVVQFNVPPGAAFDLWIDDVRFYFYCAPLGCVPTCTDPSFNVPCPANDRDPAACRPPGTDCALVATWCADPLLVDDMEDGDRTICASGGRQGVWYAVGDGTPNAGLRPREDMDFVQTAILGGRGTSHYAARLSGSGFTDWGALMGFALNAQPAANLSYDASNASGVRFWMKNSVPVAILFATAEIVPVSYGGQCVDRVGEYNCGNWFSFKMTAPSSDWVEYEVPFSALGQTDGSATWNPSHLTNISFAPQRDTTFDVWVDDVQFYDCFASPCLPTCADPAFPVRCPANAQSPAGCRPPGTDCDTYVLGCGASNTTLAPANGLIATFMGANGGDIAGDVVALGNPAPAYTTDGTLHITINAPATAQAQALLVVDRFQDCVDASGFTGVQFSISGSLSGCTMRYFTEDSVHLNDDGDPTSHGSHGIGRSGVLPPFAALTAGQVTSVTQTVMVPFAALAGGVPGRPIDIAKVTGLGWAFLVDASTGSGTPSCVADLTIDDVRFY